MGKIRVIDIRYNLDIVGEKIFDYRKAELIETEKTDGKMDKEELIEFLSKRGCPEEINENCFSDSCNHFDSDCVACWEQKPYEYEEWNDEDESY